MTGRRQACDPAADDSDSTRRLLQGQLGRHLSRTPGEGHPRPAVAIVMDEGLLTHALGSQDEARGPEAPQPYRGADHTIPRRVDRSEPTDGAHGAHPSGTVGTPREPEAEKSQSTPLEQRPTVHASPSKEVEA